MPYVAGAKKAELRIRRGDQVKVYPLTDYFIDVPWKDIFGTDWQSADAGLVQALGTVTYSDHIIQMLGYAFIVILKPGYDPTPVDSSVSLLHMNCIAEASDAGRSRVLCTK